jgi:transcriptional regulator with XRE-family HTH domain
MPDDLAGKRTGERIQILRERRGLSRPVLAGLVGMSASWLKGIEQGRRLPPRLPVLVKLAEALAVGDLTALAGTDLDLGAAHPLPVASFARIPHDAVPAIRDAVRDPMLTPPSRPVDAEALPGRVVDAWVLWHQSPQHRADTGRVLPALLTDSRAAARTPGPGQRAANAVLADVYALVQHVTVWASEPELAWTVADRAMTAAQAADTPAALASAAWTLGMVHRTVGDIDGALSLATGAIGLLAPRLDHGGHDLAGMTGSLMLHAALTSARAGREGDAWRYWDQATALAKRLPAGYHHPWTMFGTANIALHAVSINADLSKSAAARSQAEQIDPAQIPSRERRGRLGVEIARTYHQRRDYTATLHWLEYAHQTAPDSVHYSPVARQMTADTLDHGGTLITQRARDLATSISLHL